MSEVLTQVPWLVAWHFGHLSPVEQALVIALGVGPFLLLGIVVTVVRRHEDDEADETSAEGETGSAEGGRAGRAEERGAGHPATAQPTDHD